MNRFELYCMIFYVLDAEWDENHNETLEVFLSEANPYTFTDRQSADPAIGAEIADMWISFDLPDEISADDAYSFVKNYLQSNTSFAAVFDVISLSEWRDLCDIVTGEEATTG